MRHALVCVAMAGVASSIPLAGQAGAGATQGARPPDAPAWFTNVAARVGLTFRHTNGASADRHLYEIMSGGGLFFDYDNDDWLDGLRRAGRSMRSFPSVRSVGL